MPWFVAAPIAAVNLEVLALQASESPELGGVRAGFEECSVEILAEEGTTPTLVMVFTCLPAEIR
ncbi:MAG: hypothetical protein V1792_07290 [Pseudomonadota bacterium]